MRSERYHAFSCRRVSVERLVEVLDDVSRNADEVFPDPVTGNLQAIRHEDGRAYQIGWIKMSHVDGPRFVSIDTEVDLTGWMQDERTS